MSGPSIETVFLCPRYLDTQPAAGTYPRCELERIGCRQGELDDPCCRPLVDSAGRVLTRASLWWLRQTVGPLTRRFDQNAERHA